MYEILSMQMKRSAGSRPTSATVVENYEHMLMCLICRSLFDDHDHQPKFLPCHHTFCKECLREYVRQMGDDIECPSCRKVATIPAAGVAALQTNFYAKYIQNLVCGSGKDEHYAMCVTHFLISVIQSFFTWPKYFFLMHMHIHPSSTYKTFKEPLGDKWTRLLKAGCLYCHPPNSGKALVQTLV